MCGLEIDSLPLSPPSFARYRGVEGRLLQGRCVCTVWTFETVYWRFIRFVRKRTRGVRHAELTTTAGHAYYKSICALGATVSADMRNSSENSGRSADILSELADLLNDYQKKQDVLAAGIRKAEDEADRIREGQDYLAAVTLQRVSGFLHDALA